MRALREFIHQTLIESPMRRERPYKLRTKLSDELRNDIDLNKQAQEILQQYAKAFGLFVDGNGAYLTGPLERGAFPTSMLLWLKNERRFSALRVRLDNRDNPQYSRPRYGPLDVLHAIGIGRPLHNVTKDIEGKLQAIDALREYAVTFDLGFYMDNGDPIVFSRGPNEYTLLRYLPTRNIFEFRVRHEWHEAQIHDIVHALENDKPIHVDPDEGMY